MALMCNRPILSICIPTYNRGLLLEQSIRNMIPVCLQNNIQIYVSDNASPDNTATVMASLVSEYDFIHYHRHPENIGSDDNFEFVLKMADTRYRWLMSDTTFATDIKDLMSDLASEDWDGYILNGDPYRAQHLPQEKTKYSESISVMKDIGWHLTWISCMIYHERLINSLNFERYKNSSFNQTALMFEPTANRTCKICFNPYIVVDNLPVEKESGWLYHVFEVMYRQWYLLIMSLPLYYPYEVKKKCIVDAAKKPVLLSMRFHILRRMENKWNWEDVFRNRFFIKQAGCGYYGLLMLGFVPSALIRKTMLWGHYMREAIRYFGIKV